MKFQKLTITITALLMLSLTLIADEEEKQINPADTITMAELRDHMYYLASDDLGGRIVGTPGYKLATQYAVSQFKAADLIPILKDKNGKPTFIQIVPLKQSGYTKGATWTITNPGGTKEIKAGTGIKVFHVSGERVTKEARELHFIGFGISEPDHGWDDLEDLDLKDKVAVLMSGTPQKDGEPVLPADIEKSYLGMPGLNKRINALIAKGITSYIYIANDELKKKWDLLPDKVSNKATLPKGRTIPKGMDILVSTANDEISRFIMDGQEYSPFINPANPSEGYKTFPMTGTSIKLNATREEVNIETWNIVGMIPGKDEALKDEFIVLGGHLDHIPPVGGEICNGADDNASGSIAVIETGEALAMKDNKRSILICLWAAEEVGLFGSRYFVANPPVKLEQMKININLDMIARTDKLNEKTRGIHAMGTTTGSPALKDFLEQVNGNSVNWPLRFSDKEFGVGGSDHQMFVGKGIPALFFYSGPHEDYHRPTDDAEKLDWEKFLNVSRLACDLVDSLANTDIPLDSFKKAPADK